MMDAAAAERIEIDLLLEGVRRRYGYDFSQYSFPSLHRRLLHARGQAGLARFSELLDRVLHDERALDLLLAALSVTVTEMFRDPPFYVAVREKVVPLLRTFPFIKVWHAGCATGEEVYSMAILLHEEGLLERARIYATDFNKHSLDAAESGVYPARLIERYAENYRAAEGRGELAEYYSAGYDLARIKGFLKERVTFAYHNLVSDGVFGEMNLISCRNVLIYFDKKLQDRTLGLLCDSLRHGGYLCLGNRETLNFSSVRDLFDPVEAKQKVYKKRAQHHA
jgi:chemotaxis protein methyltransferase CheR